MGSNFSILEVTDLKAIGQGIERPEQVLVTAEGRVYASDKESAVAEILPSGGLHRVGRAGGEPNGIALNPAGCFVIANFGLGQLQEVDPASGALRVVIGGEVSGRSLQWLNYVLVDSSGAMWASVCTLNPDLQHTLAYGTADGYVFRLDPDGSNPTIVADGINFPNCMALDRDGEYLYVVRTILADVVRFRVEGDRLGPEEIYSPPMGQRRPDEYGDQARALMQDPEVGRRWGLADGCAFDAEGNLWVTLVGAHRIVAVTPQRELITVAEDPAGQLINSPTSVAWGGSDWRDIYIGSLATPYVLRGRSSVRGMPMVHQR